MAYRIFTVPIQDTGQAVSELNGFLGSHKILSVDRRWVEQGSMSFWSFCVDYLESAAAGSPQGRFSNQRGKIDYKEILKPEDFAVFAKLPLPAVNGGPEPLRGKARERAWKTGQVNCPRASESSPCV